RSLVTLGTNPVIPWHFLQRAGSEPCYLWTFGHQRVPQMSPDTQVVVKLYDGEPAITVHSFGKGKAIHLNMFTFEPFDPYEFSSFQAESLRELFDNLLQWHGLKPFLTVEWPLLYGQAVDHWTLYQYRLKDSPVRVLALFSDRTSPAITAQVVLREPVEEVIDVLANQRLPLRRRSGGLTTEETEPFAFTKSNRATLPAGYFFPVSLSPGQVAFFALVPFKMVPVQAALRKSQLIAGRDYLELTITVPEEKGKPASDSRPVHLDIFGPRGQPLPEMSRRLNVKGKQTLFLPIPLTAPGGRWRLNITDVLSGYQKRLFPLIVAADNLPEPPDIFSASTQPKRIEISDREFCLLLENLRKIYLTGGTGDKVSLSYYCFESDISRHRIAQLLLETDWLKKVDALKKYLASGQTVILLGEDLGFDPESGLSLETLTEENSDPSVDSAAGGKLPALPSASIIPAIEKLTETRDLMARLQKERRLVLPVGKGKILLDLASFDQAGQENSLFHLSHYRWLQSLPVEFRQE
ncbi:MAG TPA: hypothetical protein PKW42_05625, partial [bacterium]|nr:hypothetical protein [bacterium]